MSNDDTVRGFDSVFATATAAPKSRGGSRAPSPNSALNAAHAVLACAGGELNALDITLHALGNGFYQSNSAKPQGALAHSLNEDTKKDGGVFCKTANHGMFALRANCRDPLAIPVLPVADAIRDKYAVLVENGRLDEINIASVVTSEV